MGETAGEDGWEDRDVSPPAAVSSPSAAVQASAGAAGALDPRQRGLHGNSSPKLSHTDICICTQIVQHTCNLHMPSYIYTHIRIHAFISRRTYIHSYICVDSMLTHFYNLSLRLIFRPSTTTKCLSTTS